MSLKPTLVIADDHALVLEGTRRILEPEYELVACVADGRSLVAAAERYRPDAVLLDMAMPNLNGIEAARQIRQTDSQVKLVFVSMHNDRQYVHEAFCAGANAYVLKQSAPAELLKAIREVLAGRFYLSPLLTAVFDVSQLDRTMNPGDLFGSRLTPRQREVLQLVAEGKAIKEIAGVLNISVKTVEFHKAGIMEELGLRTTAELTRYAIEHRIVAGLHRI